jgi:DNA-binding SARP family transcriptional activator
LPGGGASIHIGAPILRIRLLGELDLRHGQTPLPPFESARVASLLAYLLLHRETPQPRQHLAFVLWPDSTEPQARTNLRHVLHNLRRALPDNDQFLDVTPRTLQWRPDSPFWLDVAAFEAAVSRAAAESGGSGLADLREAVEMYTGDLFEGCYDEWILGERERVRQRYLEALERLTTLLEARGDQAQAIPYAERLLRHDPLHEETYRLLMRLHDARGDRARALRVYHVCAATLERELSIKPSARTRAAYEALLPEQQSLPAKEIPAGGVGGPPLVGRGAEEMRLKTLWRATETGGVHFVLVTGEPGIGKTRLIEEFRTWCVQRGAGSAVARAYAAEGALAYAPVVEWLRSEALQARLERLDPAHLTELSRLLPELLSEVAGLTPPDPLPERDQRQRLFDAAAQVILAPGPPLMLVAEDLHWWDQESLRFLHYLLRAEPDARVLVTSTARREEVDSGHPLNDLRTGLLALERFTEIDLSRLSPEDTAVLAATVTRQPLDESDVGQLYRETEGNPLFVVEALRAGWERRDTGTGGTSPKVQAVIEARLGQLSEPTRALVEVAATIGREFTSDVLAGASEADENELVRSLDELWRRRLIREQGADAYDFSHDKIREVAYLAVSPARRRRHHLRVGQALERLYAHDPGPVSGQIAGHYDRAAVAGQAVAWYARAAEVAQQVYANVEAIRVLGRALDLLRTLPPTAERDARELQILTAFPGPVAAVEGFSSSRLADIRQRAGELALSLDVELAPPLLRSLALASLSNEDFGAARLAGLQLLARGEREEDGILVVEAEYVLGIADFWSGELEAARRHFEAALDRYRPEHHRAHLLGFGQDTKVVCLSRLGNTLWFLGFPEAAKRARDEARALADEIAHPYSRAVALTFAALLALEMHDLEYLRECVAALRAGRLENEARQIQIGSEVFAGYVDILDGSTEAGMARIQRALDDSHQTQHAPGGRSFMTRLFLEACAVTGDGRAGLAAADRALASGGARLWEAEVRRLRAEFLAVLGGSENDIEAELRQALQVAHDQGAKILELRAAMSLLRHRLKRGDSQGETGARQLLAELLAGISEGQATRDLREAAALLIPT